MKKLVFPLRKRKSTTYGGDKLTTFATVKTNGVVKRILNHLLLIQNILGNY